jgi:hypothetical protein
MREAIKLLKNCCSEDILRTTVLDANNSSVILLSICLYRRPTLRNYTKTNAEVIRSFHGRISMRNVPEEGYRPEPRKQIYCFDKRPSTTISLSKHTFPWDSTGSRKPTCRYIGPSTGVNIWLRIV